MSTQRPKWCTFQNSFSAPNGFYHSDSVAMPYRHKKESSTYYIPSLIEGKKPTIRFKVPDIPKDSLLPSCTSGVEQKETMLSNIITSQSWTVKHDFQILPLWLFSAKVFNL